MTKDLYSVLDKVIERKWMVRFAAWPGGHRHIAIYDSEKQSKQHLYEAESMEELEVAVLKDWKHLLTRVPPGFPRPPGV